MTKIRANKDLINNDKCFTKGNVYKVNNQYKGRVNKKEDLINRMATNDQDEPHIIGMWYRNFTIIK